MKSSGARVGLRGQVMATIFLLALVEGFIALYLLYDAHIETSRGAFLNKHYNRYDAYRQGLGRAMATNAALAARGFDLGEAVENPARRERLLGAIASALQTTSNPDLFVVVDKRGNALDGPGTTRLPPAELAQSRLVQDALNGMTIAGELAVIDGHVYQVAAVGFDAPEREPPEPVANEPTAEEEVERVGALILGNRVERTMLDYQQQSDPAPTKQHRLTLTGRDGQILASVFAEDELGELAPALQEDNWEKAREGEDLVDVIHTPDHLWDFHRDDDVRGYRGNEYGDLGAFFLMRQRDFKASAFDERVGASAIWLGLFVLLTLVVGALLAQWITRRVRLYVKATEDLARGRGDLTRRLTVDRRDELGRLAENLNAVFAYTHDLAAKVQRAAFQVGASSAEISAASRQMLDGAQEQARKTESSTAAVTELSASIQQVAENATEATRVARSSGEAVRNAIASMNEIRSTVDEAAARIHELGESGKRIGNIVEVIRQISDQTTLLALNAAIEAAHAGEQGRGFAVVADEVSGLATRVGQSARDIEDLIATIKEQTVDAVRAMELGTHEVEQGTKMVTATLADLQTLIGVVEDTAHAVQEQAVASDEIARNMDTVQRIAQDVLSSSEEAVDQGEHLHRLAHGLEESVKGFRIGSSPTPAEDPPPQLPPTAS